MIFKFIDMLFFAYYELLYKMVSDAEIELVTSPAELIAL